MKKKTKLFVWLTSAFMIGGAAGVGVGYGIWGSKGNDSGTSETVPQDDAGSLSGDSLKPAFRFGLGNPVKKAYSGSDADLLTIPTTVSAYNTSYMSGTSSYNGATGKYSFNTNGVLLKANRHRTSYGSQETTTSYYESNLTAFVKKINDEVSANAKLRKVAIIGEEYYGFDASSASLSTKAEDFSGVAFTKKNDNAVTGGYSVVILDISDVSTVSALKRNVLTMVSGGPAGSSNSTAGYDYYIGLGFKLLEYKNSLTDGVTKDIYVDCDKNYSKETIISSISAKDLFGKDVPVTVTEGLDSFTPQTIGVYTLKLKGTDSYGQSATATLIVHIVDYVAPAVTQAKQLTFTADKGQSLKYADLGTYISVTDNGTSHGSSLTVTYTYDGATMDSAWTKTFLAADYGTHSIKVVARDGSGNQTEKTFTLKVNDGTAPVISRRDGQAVNSRITVGVSKTFATSLSDILQMYKAVDNVDGDVSGSLAGVADADRNFFTSNHKVGNYTLNITAKDKDDNIATLAIPVTVSADMPPVFLISDTLIYTDTATPLTTAAINKVIANGVLADKTLTSLNVDASDYIGHEEEAGTYTVTYDYTESTGVKSARRFNAETSDVKSGSLDIIVKEASKTDEDDDKEDNWFVRFFKAIGEFFEKLGNWFRGVFTKGKFDCGITNEEWNLRFPPKDGNTVAPGNTDNLSVSQGQE